jgi:speckle-type POZ protein
LATLDQTLAIGLFVTDDRYLLEQLKIECENFMVRRMSAANRVELFLLPDNHPAEHLKTLAVHHFRRFSAEVMATDVLDIAA